MADRGRFYDQVGALRDVVQNHLLQVLALVAMDPPIGASADELREFLAPNFAKWWLPDRFEFVAEIPKTAVGKFRKTALREQFAQAPVATP